MTVALDPYYEIGEGLDLSTLPPIPAKVSVEIASQLSAEDFTDMFRKRMQFYQYHPLGAETWIEDHIYANMLDFETGVERWMSMGSMPETPHPETGRSYAEMWQWQKENFIRPAVARDENNILMHHTVVNCQPRGEGKSYQTVLLILWRFFTQQAQTIILGANSKDQSKFALYDIIKKIIVNSPPLIEILGQENIKEKEIRLCDSNGNIVSKIIPVSAFTGVYSNITGYAFSEIFDMTNPKFFYQLDSSRRNIPNAQGYIDSTVSEKGHVLHNLYTASPLQTNEDPGIMYCYRFSDKANYDDYLHPCMTQKQLNSFRTKFTEAEFARYFKNTWDLLDTSVFKPAMIMSMRYIGASGQLGKQAEILSTCQQIVKLKHEQDQNPLFDNSGMIKSLQSDLVSLPYTLEDNMQPRSISLAELEKLSDTFDTNWGIGVGVDFADPLKDDVTRGARTMVSFIAKGLPGSRSDPQLHITLGDKARYIYFLLNLVHSPFNEPSDVQESMENFTYEFGNILTFCSERWGAGEMRKYCEEKDIQLELISPTYERQRTGFNELYRLVKSGRFKAPPTVVTGSDTEDVMQEEMEAFRHDVHKKWYGSLTKKTQTGVQDDCMFSLCWGLFGLREKTPDDFMSVNNDVFMGQFVPDSSISGKY